MEKLVKENLLVPWKEKHTSNSQIILGAELVSKYWRPDLHLYNFYFKCKWGILTYACWKCYEDV